MSSSEEDFPDFGVPTSILEQICNAAELQSEWRCENPAWDELIARHFDESPPRPGVCDNCPGPSETPTRPGVCNNRPGPSETPSHPAVSDNRPGPSETPSRPGANDNHPRRSDLAAANTGISDNQQSSRCEEISPSTEVMEETTEVARELLPGPSGVHLVKYICDVCKKHFSSKGNLAQHLKTHSGEKPFVCSICEKSFNRKCNLNRHSKISHVLTRNSTAHECPQCHKLFSRKYNMREHIRAIHPSSVKRKIITRGSLSKRIKSERMFSLNVFSSHLLTVSEAHSQDFLLCFNEIRPKLVQLLDDEMIEKQSLKWRIIVKVQLSRVGADGENQIITPYFNSKFNLELIPNTIPDHIEQSFAKVVKSFEDFVQLGSGWTLDYIILIELLCAKYAPLSGNSYIPLHKYIQNKKAVLNIKNLNDDKCLVWCLIAHRLKLSSTQRPHLVNHYLPYEHTINLGNIECPIPIHKIPLVEKLNNLRINVFGCEDTKVFPLHISDRPEDDCINLLLISDGEKHHYCLIRSMSRLVSDVTNHNGATFVCNRCLHRFSSEHLLLEHDAYCKNQSPQHIKMPTENDNILEFTNIRYQHPVPFVIYADFESLIVPLPHCSDQLFTQKSARHDACGYAYIVIGPDGQCIKPIVAYRGADAAFHFIKNLIQEKEEISKKINEVKPMALSPQQEIDFQMASHCNICNKPLGKDRVRDHDHLTGQYRGALHNRCNLQFCMRKIVPVVFHNLKNYDAHHIIKILGRFTDYDCNIIATNMERYVAFTLICKEKKIGVKVVLQFIDSYQFLPASLEKLVANLAPSDFHILNRNMPADKIELLLRKGVYPYEYINSFSKFDDRSLPPIDAFYSSLSRENISTQDYKHALNVWCEFQIQNLGEYHDLYVKSDVLQLADVFENFRKLCLKNYDIDPAHLLTAPGMAWQASLKMTRQPLELFCDIDMYLFIESGIRGGISTITKRYAVANNVYLEKTYDSTSPSKFILYLDANNLYGWAMSQYLPYGDFKWIAPVHITENWIMSIPEDSEEGYIFEVDLHYPKELHDLHNDYPVAPEKIEITEDMLSPQAKRILEMLHHQKFKSSKKLVPNLRDKKNYITYYKNLQFYLSLGLKLTKTHRILKFKQRPWLKSYIDFNTEKRKKASSTFEKDFFKLLNNSVYGKTMENLRNRVDIQLVNSEQKAKKLIASPSFRHFKIFSENLTGVERVKTSILLNRPLYVGFVILEMSKLLMYRFHYTHIKNHYGERAKLLFTDTDSLTYEIETEDVYKDMYDHRYLYDTSDYPVRHALHSDENKKKIGCFKDEMNSEPIQEFVGLRSKMYSIKSENYEKKTAKGVSHSVIKHELKHNTYLKCLLDIKATREKMRRIGSESHQLYTLEQNKIALSCFDDKRWILKDNINTLAYGHYKIGEHT